MKLFSGVYFFILVSIFINTGRACAEEETQDKYAQQAMKQFRNSFELPLDNSLNNVRKAVTNITDKIADLLNSTEISDAVKKDTNNAVENVATFIQQGLLSAEAKISNAVTRVTASTGTVLSDALNTVRKLQQCAFNAGKCTQTPINPFEDILSCTRDEENRTEQITDKFISISDELDNWLRSLPDQVFKCISKSQGLFGWIFEPMCHNKLTSSLRDKQKSLESKYRAEITNLAKLIEQAGTQIQTCVDRKLDSIVQQYARVGIFVTECIENGVDA